MQVINAAFKCLLHLLSWLNDLKFGLELWDLLSWKMSIVSHLIGEHKFLLVSE